MNLFPGILSIKGICFSCYGILTSYTSSHLSFVSVSVNFRCSNFLLNVERVLIVLSLFYKQLPVSQKNSMTELD